VIYVGVEDVDDEGTRVGKARTALYNMKWECHVANDEIKFVINKSRVDASAAKHSQSASLVL